MGRRGWVNYNIVTTKLIFNININILKHYQTTFAEYFPDMTPQGYFLHYVKSKWVNGYVLKKLDRQNYTPRLYSKIILQNYTPKLYSKNILERTKVWKF